MLSMINNDMHHMLVKPMKTEDQVTMYRGIQEHLW